MTLKEMIAKVKAGNQNPTFTEEDYILPLINQALSMVAKRFCIDELAATAMVTIAAGTSAPVSMPDDYFHDLYQVENSTYRHEMLIRSNRKVLERLFTGSQATGPVTDVAVVGNSLYFQPSPAMDSDQTLLLYYYSIIEEYEAEDKDESPEWIPDWLHQGLVVDFVLKELWALEEDEIDGQRVNTAFYENKHNIALQEMAHHTRRTPRQRPVIKRTARFF